MENAEVFGITSYGEYGITGCKPHLIREAINPKNPNTYFT
jgi:hypothetical protein